MHSDLRAMELPAFELDCRDWLVSTPDDGSAPEEIAGAPVVAVLSTAIIESDDLLPGSALLSVGLLEDDRADSATPTAELLDLDLEGGFARYMVPVPDSQLALVAEFSCDRANADMMERFGRLMSSFRWTS
jgi:hypothetical protein